MSERSIILHTALGKQGGTARVADLLSELLPQRGLRTLRTFQIHDHPSAVGVHLPQEVGMEGLAATWGAADILHLHSALDWDIALDAAEAIGHPLVLTLHDCRLLTGGCAYPGECGLWESGCRGVCPQNEPAPADRFVRNRRTLTRLTPTLVTPSRWLARMVAQVLSGADIRVIPNGVPWPDAVTDRVQARAALAIPDGLPAVLLAGHGGVMTMRCRQGEWRELVDGIRGAVPEAWIFVAGGGGQASHQDRVFHCPYAGREKFLQLMAACDVLAYPSHADNHPMTILEAMSLGVPVAAYASGGIPEQLRHEDTGLLVPTGDTPGLAAVVSRLLRRPGLARRLGEMARHKGGRVFSAGRMAGDYARVYLG